MMLLLGALLALVLAMLGLVVAQRPDALDLGPRGMIVLDDRAVDVATGLEVMGPCPACGPTGFPGSTRTGTDGPAGGTGHLRFPSWSADGSRFAYLDPGASIMVLDVASGAVTPTDACTGCVVDDRPGIPPLGAISISPDGTEVAFAEDGRIKVVDIATRQVRALADAIDGQPASAPAWSPDGRWVAYMVGSHGQRRGGGVWLIAADGRSAPQQLVDGSAGDPAWSPDGTTIAYAGDRLDKRGLWLVGRDGRQPRQLTTDAGCFLSSGAPVWAPDGTRIAVGFETTDTTGTSCALWLVDPANPARRSRIADGRGSHAAWRPEPPRPVSSAGSGS